MVKETADGRGPWTVPNALCGLRFLGLAPLLWAAHEGHRTLFLGIVVALLLTDWLDGKLAKVLHQRTVLGARLDSGVDALLYAAVALSFWWLEEAMIRAHLGWLLGVLASWLLSAAVGVIRFRRLPSYHMWSAKIAWFTVACTILILLLDGDPFLLPWALGLVIFSNLHAVAITLALPRWEVDVWSLRRALRMRREKT